MQQNCMLCIIYPNYVFQSIFRLKRGCILYINAYYIHQKTVSSKWNLQIQVKLRLTTCWWLTEAGDMLWHTTGLGQWRSGSLSVHCGQEVGPLTPRGTGWPSCSVRLLVWHRELRRQSIIANTIHYTRILRSIKNKDRQRKINSLFAQQS